MFVMLVDPNTPDKNGWDLFRHHNKDILGCIYKPKNYVVDRDNICGLTGLSPNRKINWVSHVQSINLSDNLILSLSHFYSTTLALCEGILVQLGHQSRIYCKNIGKRTTWGITGRGKFFKEKSLFLKAIATYRDTKFKIGS